jgi:ketosteroid isomerase-like protein
MFKNIPFLIVVLIVLTSCEFNKTSVSTDTGTVKDSTMSDRANDIALREVLQKHLNAVSERNLDTLRATLAPNGQMHLILPSTEIIDGVDGFMNYHEEWFAVPDWTFTANILNSETGPEIGMALVEVMYREPERNGKPYFNRMIVSYDLKKIDNKWYVIKDHASSVEQSTDSNTQQ